MPLDVINLLNLRIDKTLNTLYLPLSDTEGNVSGFRIFEIAGQTILERTIPTNDCNGLSSAKATKSRDSSATIVPSIK